MKVITAMHTEDEIKEALDKLGITTKDEISFSFPDLRIRTQQTILESLGTSFSGLFFLDDQQLKTVFTEFKVAFIFQNKYYQIDNFKNWISPSEISISYLVEHILVEGVDYEFNHNLSPKKSEYTKALNFWASIQVWRITCFSHGIDSLHLTEFSTCSKFFKKAEFEMSSYVKTYRKNTYVSSSEEAYLKFYTALSAQDKFNIIERIQFELDQALALTRDSWNSEEISRLFVVYESKLAQIMNHL